MIYGITKDVAGELARRGFPMSCYYDNERIPTQLNESYLENRAVFTEVDPTGGDDTFQGPINASHAKNRLAWMQQIVIMVYGSSAEPGARASEHRDEVRRLVAGVVTALKTWDQVTGAGGVVFQGGRFIRPDEVGADATAGAAYRLRVVIPRALPTTHYNGSWHPVTRAAGAANTVNANQPGHDPASALGGTP